MSFCKRSQIKCATQAHTHFDFFYIARAFLLLHTIELHLLSLISRELAGEMNSAYISSKNIIHCSENTSWCDSYFFIFLFGSATDLNPNNYWSPWIRRLKTELLLHFKASHLLQRRSPLFLNAISISIRWIIYLSEMAYLLEIGNNFQKQKPKLYQ